MLEVEHVMSYAGQGLSILVAAWVYLKVDKPSGALLLFSFLVVLIQGLVLVHNSDAIKFEPKIVEGLIYDIEVNAPWWYQVLTILGMVASLGLPVGLLLLAKKVLSLRT